MSGQLLLRRKEGATMRALRIRTDRMCHPVSREAAVVVGLRRLNRVDLLPEE